MSRRPSLTPRQRVILNRLVDGEACARLAAAGLLRRDGGSLALTDRGRFLANDVVASVLR